MAKTKRPYKRKQKQPVFPSVVEKDPQEDLEAEDLSMEDIIKEESSPAEEKSIEEGRKIAESPEFQEPEQPEIEELSSLEKEEERMENEIVESSDRQEEAPTVSASEPELQQKPQLSQQQVFETLTNLVERSNALEAYIVNQDKTITGLSGQMQQATQNTQALAGMMAESMGVSLPSQGAGAPPTGVGSGLPNLPSILPQSGALMSQPTGGIDKISPYVDIFVKLLPLLQANQATPPPDATATPAGLMKNMMEMLSLFTNMQNTILGNGLDGYVRLAKQMSGIASPSASVKPLPTSAPLLSQPPSEG